MGKKKNSCLYNTAKSERTPADLQKYNYNQTTSKVKVKHKKLLQYIDVNQKYFCLLSTMHASVTIVDRHKKLHETVSFYNSTNCGVDVL